MSVLANNDLSVDPCTDLSTDLLNDLSADLLTTLSTDAIDSNTRTDQDQSSAQLQNLSGQDSTWLSLDDIDKRANGDLAIFDLDHTLLGGDSNMIWADYLFERGLVDAAFIQQRDSYFAEYKEGTLDFEAYLDYMLAPYAQIEYQTLVNYRDDCFKTHVKPNLYPQGIELIAAHRQAGDTVIIISATNEFLIEPVGKALGVTDLIGVELTRDEQGNFTGRYHGVPSFGAGKQTRLLQSLDSQGRQMSDYQRSYFYSDSINDAPLLESVTDAIVVNPDAKLKALAERKDWPVLTFEL